MSLLTRFEDHISKEHNWSYGAAVRAFLPEAGLYANIRQASGSVETE